MFKNRSRIATTIWSALVLTACFGLWHILPDSFRNHVEPVAHAANFTVNTADDHNDGVCNTADCTLREAINAANAGDTISFNIPGSGVHTINATNGFSITKAVTIDGTTQPGYAGAPLIELNGAGAGVEVNGLNINASNVIIKGLIINRFSGYGINFDSFGNSSVQGCYIGTNATGTAAMPNRNGVLLWNGTKNNIIGGAEATARNIISGNSGLCMLILGAGTTGNQVLGNYVGTDVTGTAAILNLGNIITEGVVLADGATNNTIGGTTAAARNVISGHVRGVVIADDATANNTVAGNYVGTNAAGTASIGNAVGVQVNIVFQNNAIGGTAAGAANLISGNDVGISIYESTSTQILGNFIGTSPAGTAAMGNRVGVVLIHSPPITPLAE